MIRKKGEDIGLHCKLTPDCKCGRRNEALFITVKEGRYVILMYMAGSWWIGADKGRICVHGEHWVQQQRFRTVLY